MDISIAEQAFYCGSRPAETSGRGETSRLHKCPTSRPITARAPFVGGSLQTKGPERSISCASDTKGASGDTATDQIDASSIFVDTAFRATPWDQEKKEERSKRTQAQILFVSESNVCRSVLAEAVMNRLIKERGMEAEVMCESKGTRDYNVGEGPEPFVLEVAREEGLALPASFQARQLVPETDIVAYDVVLVMDKFTAADVLREVSVFDSINSQGGYSTRVRRLGEFHPTMSTATATDAQDLDDPLYGNANNDTEKEAARGVLKSITEACEGLMDSWEKLRSANGNSRTLSRKLGAEEAVRGSLRNITEACEGLMAFLEKLRDADGTGDGSLRSKLIAAVQNMESVDWLVPPMLQKR